MTTIGYVEVPPLSEDSGRHSSMTSASTATTKESSSASTAASTAVGATRPKLVRRDSGMSAALQSAIRDHIDRQGSRRQLREKAAFATGFTGSGGNGTKDTSMGSRRENDNERDAVQVLDAILSSDRVSSQTMTERALALQKAISNYLERAGSSGNIVEENDSSGREGNRNEGTRKKGYCQDTVEAKPTRRASVTAMASRSFISIASSSSMSLFDDPPTKGSVLALASRTLAKDGEREESKKFLSSSMPGNFTSELRCPSRQNLASSLASVHSNQITDSNDTPSNISKAAALIANHNQYSELDMGYCRETLEDLNDEKSYDHQHGHDKQTSNFRSKGSREYKLNGNIRSNSYNDLSSGGTEMCTSSSGGSDDVRIEPSGPDISKNTIEARPNSASPTLKKNVSFVFRKEQTNFLNTNHYDVPNSPVDSIHVFRSSFVLGDGETSAKTRMSSQRRRSSLVRQKSHVSINDEKFFSDGESPHTVQTKLMQRRRSNSQPNRSASEAMIDSDTDQHNSRLLRRRSPSFVSKTSTAERNALVANRNMIPFPQRRRTSLPVKEGNNAAYDAASSQRPRSIHIGASLKLQRRATFHQGLEPESFHGTSNTKDESFRSTRHYFSERKSPSTNDLISWYTPQKKLHMSRQEDPPSRESHVIKSSCDPPSSKDPSNTPVPTTTQEKKTSHRKFIPPPPRRRSHSAEKSDFRPPRRCLAQQRKKDEHLHTSCDGGQKRRTMSLTIRDWNNQEKMQRLLPGEMACGDADNQVKDASHFMQKTNEIDKDREVSLGMEKCSHSHRSKPIAYRNAQPNGKSSKPADNEPPPPPRLPKFDKKSGCCPKHPSVIIAYKKDPRKSGWTIIQNRCDLCEEDNQVITEKVVDPAEDRLRRSTVSKSLHREFMATIDMRLPIPRKSKVDESTSQRDRNDKRETQVNSDGHTVKLAEQAQFVINSQRFSPRSNHNFMPNTTDNNVSMSRENNRVPYNRSSSLPDRTAASKSYDKNAKHGKSTGDTSRPINRASSMPEKGNSAAVGNASRNKTISYSHALEHPGTVSQEELRRNSNVQIKSSSHHQNCAQLPNENVTSTTSIVKDMPYISSKGKGVYSGEVNQRGEPHGVGSFVYGVGCVYEGKWADGHALYSTVLNKGEGLSKGGILKRNNSLHYHQWGQSQHYHQKSNF